MRWFKRNKPRVAKYKIRYDCAKPSDLSIMFMVALASSTASGNVPTKLSLSEDAHEELIGLIAASDLFERIE